MIHLDTYGTLVAATLVLLLGRKLVKSVSFLEKYISRADDNLT